MPIWTSYSSSLNHYVRSIWNSPTVSTAYLQASNSSSIDRSPCRPMLKNTSTPPSSSSQYPIRPSDLGRIVDVYLLAFMHSGPPPSPSNRSPCRTTAHVARFWGAHLVVLYSSGSSSSCFFNLLSLLSLPLIFFLLCSLFSV